jgi:hypothetical protein
MVGAEGFEASFPSVHYAVFFVGFNSKTSLHQGLAEFSGVPLFPNFLTNGQNSARIWYHWYHPSFEIT